MRRDWFWWIWLTIVNRQSYILHTCKKLDNLRHNPAAVLEETMAKEEEKNGNSRSPLKGKEYMKELRKLQTELCHLQEWVKTQGLRVVVVLEGRDAAGKGGTIRANAERVAPASSDSSPCLHPPAVKSPDVFTAFHSALPCRRRGGDLRPQLVRPRRISDPRRFALLAKRPSRV